MNEMKSVEIQVTQLKSLFMAVECSVCNLKRENKPFSILFKSETWLVGLMKGSQGLTPDWHCPSSATTLHWILQANHREISITTREVTHLLFHYQRYLIITWMCFLIQLKYVYFIVYAGHKFHIWIPFACHRCYYCHCVNSHIIWHWQCQWDDKTFQTPAIFIVIVNIFLIATAVTLIEWVWLKMWCHQVSQKDECRS